MWNVAEGVCAIDMTHNPINTQNETSRSTLFKFFTFNQSEFCRTGQLDSVVQSQSVALFPEGPVRERTAHRMM
jgi:hypothetical protein